MAGVVGGTGLLLKMRCWIVGVSAEGDSEELSYPRRLLALAVVLGMNRHLPHPYALGAGGGVLWRGRLCLNATAWAGAPVLRREAAPVPSLLEGAQLGPFEKLATRRLSD